MELSVTSGVNGYVLAGGKSSRMGRDKALLELAGKSLILRAVEKLQRVGMDVYVLSNRPELGAYAPLVRDLHKGCGPLGGVEAALSHSTKMWNLFMAVDMPFLPSGFLSAWVRMVVGQVSARVAMFTVEGRPQPALCLLHKDVAPYVREAVERGEFRLLLALEAASKELAVQQGVGLERVLLNLPWDQEETALFCKDGTGWTPTEAQQVMRYLWFANLNTPQELAAVEGFAGALEVD